MLHHRAYRYRFYPTAAQAEQLARSFGCARYVYNWALATRSEAFFERQERLYAKQLSARLTVLKQQPETAWLNEVSAVVLQQALRHLDGAFARFFQKQAAYPVFKSRKGDQSCTFMANAFTFREGRLTLAKHDEPLDIRWSRPLPDGCVPSSVTVTRTAGGKFYASLLVEQEIAALPAVADEIGVDFNTAVLVGSNGQRFSVPKRLKTQAARRQRYQRACRRKIEAAKVALGYTKTAALPKGVKLPVSANLKKAFAKAGRVADTIGNIRRDWQHKTTTTLIRENQTIVVEDLYVRGMTASAKGSVTAPGSRVAQKAGLNRSVLEVGFHELRRQLTYKALWAGRTLIVVDRWYPSSKRCSDCGYTRKQLALNQRKWTCPQCGQVHDRDVNAARNLLAAGKAEAAGAAALRIHE